MTFEIDNSIRVRFPSLHIGVLLAEGIDNTATNNTYLEAELRYQEQQVRAIYPDLEALDNHRSILEWRQVYRTQGVNPKKFMPTVESLVRRIQKGYSFPFINTVVNTYLLGELTTLCPVGGYDLDKVEGAITLRLSEGNEPFVTIDGKEDKTLKDEIVYSDQQTILTRFWNYRDCYKTQITPESKRIALFVECPTDQLQPGDLARTLDTISSRISQYCGGKINSIIY
ncbi:hypothetical protein IC229_30150 [Spirosoma sp. BT702]|uniref:B3/B4 tRNA-binding domain-containing protein n=1 Tax=Spirosoma profusum TaxID=2771354 RepID=A0A927G9S9_9BACT|nr:phenylalanine--tRNA ligase beta subunit-related protein [Spirosoma profusum]MBD2704932.1 hypothetical protein [Spirosoma profusum]